MGVMTFDFVTTNPLLTRKFEMCDLVILSIFTFDFILQLMYLGWMVLTDNWLIFDGVLVISSWAFMGSSIKALRTLRIFRVFALISRLESLRTVLSALWNSIPQMGSIGMILGMFQFCFCMNEWQLNLTLSLAQACFSTCSLSSSPICIPTCVSSSKCAADTLPS
jgi:Ion transport protein